MARDVSEIWPDNEPTTAPVPALPPGEAYDFDLNDFGQVPDYDKSYLDGKVLVIHGVSEAVFEGDYQTPARSLLHSWPVEYWKSSETGQMLEPYGALLSEDSPAIRQAKDMQKRGRVPFLARLRIKDSTLHKGQTYWTMEKAPPKQYDERGEYVDPNAGLYGEDKSASKKK